MKPFFRIDLLKVGDNWRDAPTHGNYTEHYVQLLRGPVPVGVMIARELRDTGAVAVCTDLALGRLRCLDCDLVCVLPPPPIEKLLSDLRAANEGRLAGLPDTIAVFPDGRVAFREAKVAGKDKLSTTQHSFARISRKLLGDRLDLAVVEWGYNSAAQTSHPRE